MNWTSVDRPFEKEAKRYIRMVVIKPVTFCVYNHNVNYDKIQENSSVCMWSLLFPFIAINKIDI